MWNALHDYVCVTYTMKIRFKGITVPSPSKMYLVEYKILVVALIRDIYYKSRAGGRKLRATILARRVCVPIIVSMPLSIKIVRRPSSVAKPRQSQPTSDKRQAKASNASSRAEQEAKASDWARESRT